MSLFTAGGNFHGNQINVGLYPRVHRTPLGVATRANANVTSGSGYVQEALNLAANKLQLTGGLRYDAFRFDVRDRVGPASSNVESAGRIQPKAGLAYTPSHRLPLALYANYGRGISSLDARSILQRPDGARVATTDFYQAGTSHHFHGFAFATDAFWIDRSNELVYVADDGSLEFLGPSRAYGFEAKASVELTRRLSVSGGLTKVLNAYFRGTEPRVYVDRAPHFTANAGLTLSRWRGWSGSVRMRTINHYRLSGQDSTIRAAGHTVFDLSAVRRIRRNLDFNFSVDNFTNRLYYETQNYIASRPYAGGPASYGIHATPGYPVTFSVGLTFRWHSH
ncbi:MAG: TonB-dependent receptor [Acidobacteria bacterium]|nr:TonB-dependent receptor [Acidobacteriota bacterium]